MRVRLRESANRQSVLHNMSCRPSAHVNHKGADRCCRLAIRGRKTLQQWAEAFSLDQSDETRILVELRRRVSATDRLGILPPVAPIVDLASGTGISGVSNDPSFALSVLARCGPRVFMREKSPVVLKNYVCRSVTIILPESWSIEP